MPGYRVHTAAGILLFGGLVMLLPAPYIAHTTFLLSGLCATLFGSLFPDLDTKSKGQQLYAILLFLGAAYLIWHNWLACMPLLVVAALFPLFISHRGITHDPKFILLIGAIAAYVGNQCTVFTLPFVWWVICCFVGAALLHIMLDYGPYGFLRRFFSFSRS